MTKAEQQLVKDYAKTSLGWQEKNLKIVDKNSNLISLRHNIAQMKLYNARQLQRVRGLPVRIIIVKARQKGLSTGETADTFEDINRNSNRHACLISVDIDSTNKVFRMIKLFQEKMPHNEKRRTVKSNRKEIQYAEPWGSSILCQTAGKEVLGRGGTTPRIHVTEVAFWKQAEDKLYGLFQEVPKTADTSIVIESTAFGTTGAFHNRYLTAVDRLRRNPDDYNGFIPMFIPWFVDDEYSMALPRGHRIELKRDDDVFGDEVHLQEQYNLTIEQLWWRRWIIENDLDKDLSRFLQEYPSTWREAFQGTGRMVFDVNDIDDMEKACRPPDATVDFYEEEGKVKYRHVNRRQNCWSIWKWPQGNHSYIGFGDVAEGILSDPNDLRSDPDRSVAAIMDRNDHNLPATYYGRPDTIEFADQFILGCKYFNYAWASPEMNSIGQSVLDAFKNADYPFIYNREHKEETVVREDSKKLGWKTTPLTRKPMIADLQEVVMNRELTIYDKRFVDEFRVFIWNPQGKPQAEVGEHDDCVITVSGLIQLHQRCPFNEDTSWADKVEKPDRPVAVMGAYDEEDLDGDELELVYENEVFE